MTDASGIDKLTPKQQAFVEEFLQCGSAADAYRGAYNCANMGEATIRREATRLLAHPAINHTITTLRAKAAEKAVLNKAWVLDKLRKNIEVSLGEQTITLKIQKRDKESGAVTVSEVQVSAHDAAAANKGLELVARHLGMLTDKHEITGKNGEPLLPEDTPTDKIDIARRLLHLIAEAEREQNAAVMQAASQPEEGSNERATKH